MWLGRRGGQGIQLETLFHLPTLCPLEQDSVWQPPRDTRIFLLGFSSYSGRRVKLMTRWGDKQRDKEEPCWGQCRV